MNNAVFLARLIGPVALVIAVSLFINRDGYKAMAEEFLKSRALIYLSGLLTMTAGVAIILTSNVWVLNWPVIITLLGWAAAIGGAARIAVPDKVESFGRSMLRNPMAMMIGGGFWLVVGLVLCFFGYVR